MIVENAKEMKESLQDDRRLMGLDVGSKTVGLALSDLGLTIATPFRTLERKKFAPLAEELRQFVAEHNVGGMVIGLPLSMDGSEGPRCRASRDFARNLLEVFDAHFETNIPVLFHDERLSTQAVERMLIKEADMTRKRRAQVVDKAAAAYILQGALDMMASVV